MEFQDVVAIWRKLCTGTFVTSPEPELRTSSDISQWTGIGSLVAPLSFHEFDSSNFHKVARFITS